MERAYSLLTVKAVDEDERTITGIATTPSVDRVGDIVESEGAEFKLPIPLLWQHRHDQPIGHVTQAKVTKSGIEITARFARLDEEGTLKSRLDEAWQSVKSGLVRGLSIGFKALEKTELEDSYGYRFVKWLWIELSAVTIPANQDASIQTVKAIDAELLAASGHEQEGDDEEPGATGKTEPTPCAKGHVVKLKDTKPAKPFVIRKIKRIS